MRQTIKKDADKYTLDDLIGIMARLRSDEGCPWDREQDHDSLRSFLIEEAYEVLEAIENQDPEAHREELGDVLFQIVFQARVAEELGQFDLSDVIDVIARKIRRRHPHVFGTETARTSGEVVAAWERIKGEEKRLAAGNNEISVLDGVPSSLPALLAAHRLSERAARVGFDWTDPLQVIDKVFEEITELKQALDREGDKEHVAWEIGDLLFALVNLSRHLNTCAEDLLRETNQRFSSRFRLVEKMAREREIDMGSADIDTLEALWQEAKKILDAP
jgi:tetrapyrrole methylase family protein / MazG family protein